MIIAVVPAAPAHIAGWAVLRDMLWPGDGVAAQRAEIAAELAKGDDRAAFVALGGASSSVSRR